MLGKKKKKKVYHRFVMFLKIEDENQKLGKIGKQTKEKGQNSLFNFGLIPNFKCYLDTNL